MKQILVDGVPSGVYMDEQNIYTPDFGHPSAVCVMDWNRCTESWCEFYASGCPHFTE